jgi:hypothetical protein
VTYEVVPVPGENYEGRQWGYRILQDGVPFLDCHTGGTGPCWNISEPPEHYPGDDPGDPLHICELDEMIAALTALRDSGAHRENVERWE